MHCLPLPAPACYCQVRLDGPPALLSRLSASGAIRLDTGVLNLVATQFSLDREHANKVVFAGEMGLDPLLDVMLVSGDLRAVVQVRGGEGV